MATVFRALDVKHGRTVAVKVLHPELSEALGPERFLREVRITAKLSHPHILPLLDSGASDGLLYYVMPFVEGESLRDRLVREGQLPVGDALRIAREVADALGNAHSLGIVHRDVKPENILLQGGHALVADFGIARAFDGADHQLTNTGIAIGTPLYMSPEQAHGEVTVDGRSDIYSLASVLFEMLTGEPPFVGPNAMAITTKKLTETPPPLRTRRNTVSASTEVAIARALARAPADRFRTAQEFAEALDASVTTGERAVVPAPSWRRPAIAAAAVLALVAAAWAAGRGGSAGAPGAGELSSVAVLPFENLSPDTAQAYFAIGLNDEIITSLSMVEGIRVSSRTSSSLVASQGLELKVIGERLGVESVVEGSVRAYGDRIRVAARLVKVADGYPIWSQTFERASDDALKIQSEIAGAIVEALKGRMVVGHLQAVSSGTTDPVAYDLYLQAQALRLRQTDASIARAVELLRESIRRAPDFARAHATLGTALAVQGWYEQRPPREVFPLAAQAAEEAMRLDPNLGSAQATRAYASLYFDWDLPRAEREFLRAIELSRTAGSRTSGTGTCSLCSGASPTPNGSSSAPARSNRSCRFAARRSSGCASRPATSAVRSKRSTARSCSTRPTRSPTCGRAGRWRRAGGWMKPSPPRNRRCGSRTAAPASSRASHGPRPCRGTAPTRGVCSPKCSADASCPRTKWRKSISHSARRPRRCAGSNARTRCGRRR